MRVPVLLLPRGLPAVPPPPLFPVVTVEMQFTTSAWTDISAYVDFSGGRQVTITRGSSRIESPVIHYDAGTCSIPLTNVDRRFDPTNLAGPYVAGGKTQVVPMVPVRVSAVYASITYRLFTGTVDEWLLSYTAPSDAQCAVTCTDGFKQLAQQPRAGRAVYKGPGEDSGARVNRILDDAGWPGAKRNVTAGDATLQATLLGFNAATVNTTLAALAGGGGGTNVPDYVINGPAPGFPLLDARPTTVQIAAPSGTPLDELYLVADTEMGEMYIDGNGFLVFRHRNGLYLDARSTTSQATFGDDAAVPTTELPYADITPAYDHATLFTAATIANVGGNLQTAVDAVASQPFPAGYGLVVYDSESLIADSDFQALGYAQWVVATSKNPELRFSGMDIDPLDDPANIYPHALGREIGDRVTGKRRPPGGGATITRDVWIRGISHVFSDVAWLTSWTFEDASAALQPTIWNTGSWDGGIWGF